jgi:membrane protease YdiL (CAAX protease family)
LEQIDVPIGLAWARRIVKWRKPTTYAASFTAAFGVIFGLMGHGRDRGLWIAGTLAVLGIDGIAVAILERVSKWERMHRGDSLSPTADHYRHQDQH